MWMNDAESSDGVFNLVGGGVNEGAARYAGENGADWCGFMADVHEERGGAQWAEWGCVVHGMWKEAVVSGDDICAMVARRL